MGEDVNTRVETYGMTRDNDEQACRCSRRICLFARSCRQSKKCFWREAMRLIRMGLRNREQDRWLVAWRTSKGKFEEFYLWKIHNLSLKNGQGLENEGLCITKEGSTHEVELFISKRGCMTEERAATGNKLPSGEMRYMGQQKGRAGREQDIRYKNTTGRAIWAFLTTAGVQDDDWGVAPR